jgi:hypothetical protein
MEIQIQITGWGEAPDEPLVAKCSCSRGRSPHQFLFNRLAKAIQHAVPAFFALLLLALPAVAQAQFNYTTTNGTITITDYTGPGGAVTIPDTINGLPVTSIGAEAFDDCQNLTNVMIGNSVTSVGDWAFEECYNLTNVTIGNSVTTIGADAFYGCRSLIGVMIPASVTNIGLNAFTFCDSLTMITVDMNNRFYNSVNGVLFDKGQTRSLNIRADSAESVEAT